MFTGLIDHYSKILQITQKQNSKTIRIQTQFDDLVLGESIAVDGICLTVTSFDNEAFTCDISPETEAITTASQFKTGQQVNLERALQLSSRLGGHVVMGHVDQTCQLAEHSNQEGFVQLRFEGLTPETKKYIIKKGSVAVNGVSLTINSATPTSFSVMLIPHTLERTNLSQLKIGDSVNIEFDLMARILVEQYQNTLAANLGG